MIEQTNSAFPAIAGNNKPDGSVEHAMLKAGEFKFVRLEAESF